MKWFISDLHFGQRSMLIWRTQFKTIDEMNMFLIDNLFKNIKPGDILYFLGDLSMGKAGADYFFANLPRSVVFHWVTGNHDKATAKYGKQCASITPLKEIKIGSNKVVLCHYPMLTYNCSHYNAWLLYGHHHAGSQGTAEVARILNGKQLNVNCEMHNYMPWSEIEVEAYMDTRPDNWDRIIK